MRRRALESWVWVLPLALAGLGLGPAAAAAAEHRDDFGGVDFHWIPPSLHVNRWLFLLQAYYSSLDGIGIGVEADRILTVPVLSGLTHSEVEFIAKGRLYEQAHGEIQLRAETFFSGGRYAAVARFDHSTRLRQFWGVGPDLPHEDREEFRPRDLRVYLEVLRRFSGARVGPRIEMENYQYLRVEDGGLLETGDYPGVSAKGETILGVGLSSDYDSRDDRYHPSSGWWMSGLLMRFFRPGSDEEDFWSSYLDVRNYRKLSDTDVLALQFFSYGVDRGAPLWRYAAVGVGVHSRGYSRNRYLDYRMAATQAEWRRPLFWRLGMQVFGGLALVTPTWPQTRIDTIRPTLGAGLSVRIPQLTDVPIRGDLAIGDENLHGDLSIGFAF
jgi:hypothetical protein